MSGTRMILYILLCISIFNLIKETGNQNKAKKYLLIFLLVAIIIVMAFQLITM